MISYFVFLLLWSCHSCVPRRPSRWHGKLSSSFNATLTAACGEATTALDNPWAALLYYEGSFQCGATILEDQLAITAAHCINGLHKDDFSLYYGRTYQLDSAREDRGHRRFGGQTGIWAWRIHPSYNIFDKFEGYDIALLKLDRRIQFNDFVRPIKVVPTHHKYDIVYKRARSVRLAGFGQISGPVDSDNRDDYPDQMQLVMQKIVPEQRCNRGNDTFHFEPPQDGLCTRLRCGKKESEGIKAEFKQICPGDSGSGIVEHFVEDNTFYLIAVVSYAVIHGKEECGLSKKPALSIKTRVHRDFIYEDFFPFKESKIVSLQNTTPFQIPETAGSPIDGLRHAFEEKIKNCDEYKEGLGYTCVPYYQCRDGTLITDGAGLIDIRNIIGTLNAEDAKCPGLLDVCCKDPDFQPARKPEEPSYNHKCGRRNTNGVHAKIRGFTQGESQFGEWPNMVAVLGPTQQLECGGSLIAPGAVLTAAHCVNKYRSVANTLRVRAGEWDSQRETEPYLHQDRNVVAIRVHPEFHEDSLWNDFAILFTNTDFNLAPHVDTTCLPIQGSGDEFDGATCFVTGWGKDKFSRQGELQTVLKEIDLPIVNYDECQSTLRTTKLGSKFKLHISFICAGGEKGKDTCDGDGGSPLLCPSKHDPNTYVQVGLVSWGIGCGESGVPGVYADVSTAVCWIDYEMSGYYGQQIENFTSYFGYGRSCRRWMANTQSELNDKYTSLEGKSGRGNQRKMQKLRKVMDAYSRYNVEWV